MTIKDAIKQLEDLARSCPSGLDAEFMLVQLDAVGAAREMRVDYDSADEEFRFARGDDEVVIEFDV